MIGSGNFWFSTIPSGSCTPHKVLFPALYSRQACPARYPLITISTLNGSHFKPTVTAGSGTPYLTFVWYTLWEDYVECRDPVGNHHHQVIPVYIINVADLADIFPNLSREIESGLNNCFHI